MVDQSLEEREKHEKTAISENDYVKDMQNEVASLSKSCQDPNVQMTLLQL